MTDWHTFRDTPSDFFDCLARYYDASMNRFLIQRFTNCFVQDFQIIWPSPFPGSGNSVNLYEQGFRPILWTTIPEMPPELKDLPLGPEDYTGQRESRP